MPNPLCCSKRLAYRRCSAGCRDSLAFLGLTIHRLHIMILGLWVFVLLIDVCGLVDIVATTFGY